VIIQYILILKNLSTCFTFPFWLFASSCRFVASTHCHQVWHHKRFTHVSHILLTSSYEKQRYRYADHVRVGLNGGGTNDNLFPGTSAKRNRIWASFLPTSSALLYELWRCRRHGRQWRGRPKWSVRWRLGSPLLQSAS
jgi:hypothetical protein